MSSGAGDGKNAPGKGPQGRKGRGGLEDLEDGGPGGGREGEELGREEAGPGSLRMGLTGRIWDLIPRAKGSLAAFETGIDLICILTLFAF